MIEELEKDGIKVLATNYLQTAVALLKEPTTYLCMTDLKMDVLEPAAQWRILRNANLDASLILLDEENKETLSKITRAGCEVDDTVTEPLNGEKIKTVVSNSRKYRMHITPNPRDAHSEPVDMQTILIASDRSDTIDMMDREGGVSKISTVSSAGDILSALHKEIISLLIVDLRISRVNQYSFINDIQIEYSRLPIVIITDDHLLLHQYLRERGIRIYGVYVRRKNVPRLKEMIDEILEVMR